MEPIGASVPFMCRLGLQGCKRYVELGAVCDNCLHKSGIGVANGMQAAMKVKAIVKSAVQNFMGKDSQVNERKLASKSWPMLQHIVQTEFS